MIWLSLALSLFLMAVSAYGTDSAAAPSGRARWLQRLGAVLFFVSAANFLIWWHVAVAIGGDAVSGKVADGHYYVCSHGRFTEVSEPLYRYSHAHSVITQVSFLPLAALAAFLIYRADRLGKPAGKRPPDDFDA